jgi:hypothetical protein
MSGTDVTNQGTLELPIYEVISKNPYAGVMLKSQNASTWTADQNRDIKFTLYRAQFDPATPGNLTLDNLIPGSIASVTMGNHGSGYLVAPTVSFTAVGAGSGAAATAWLDGDAVGGIVMTNYGSGYVAPPLVVFTPVGADPGINASAVTTIETATFSTFNLTTQALTLPGTAIKNVLRIGAATYEIDANENYDLTAQVALTNASTFNLVCTFTTESEYISPVLDLDRASVLGVHNIINNDVSGEHNADLGGSVARYITKQISLNDVSDQLDIYLDAQRPSSECDITVYAKVKTNDALAFSALPWTTVEPANTIPVSTNINDFREVHYVFNNAGTEFSAFAIKIVMTSTNSAKVPLVKGLRVIATY